MPGCFSRLSSKFSKKEKKNEQDGPNSNGDSNVPSAGKEPLATGSSEVLGDESTEKETSPKDRWRDAFNQLPRAKQSILEEMGFGTAESGYMRSSLKDLVGEVNSKQAECEKKFWHVNVFGEKIVLREYTTRIIGWLENAGDIAVQFAPPQVSLPWDCVKSIMKIPVNQNLQMGALLATTERVVRITSRCQIYENIYLNGATDVKLSDTQRNLDSALVDIYRASLDLLAETRTLLTKGTAKRTLEVIVRPGKAEDNLAALADKEAEILNDVQACESQRSADSDERTEKMLAALQAPMARVDEGVSQLLKHMEESERIDLLEWISSIPFGKHHDTVAENRTLGTGEWLLKHKGFREWEERRSSALFWLQGTPGSGKTYLTSTVIDHVRAKATSNADRNDEGFAFFYCKRDEEPRDQPLAIFQSFVRQLSTTASHPESMQVALQRSCKKAREEGTNFRFEQCKQQILASLNIYQRTTLIIDAMDECDPKSRYELIEALQFFMTESKRVVRIFVSSRPDPKMERQLESSPNISIQADDNQDDIRKFLNKKLDELSKIEPIFESLRSEIITKLLERCQGMFQWVSLMVAQIGQCDNRPDVLDRLNDLPEDLEKAYDVVWRQIESQGKLSQVFTKRALRWVMAASKPMTSVELLAAVRMNLNGVLSSLRDTVDEQRLLSNCNNFLVMDPELKEWRFPHLSVREYLETKEDWSTPHAHYHAASVCLSYFVNKYEHDDDLELDAKLEADLQIDSERPEDADTPYKPLQSDDGFHTLHPFHIHMRHSWFQHVKGSKDIETTNLASLLKTFLGSPNESSVQYQRWHQKTANDFDSLPHFHPRLGHHINSDAEVTFLETSPAHAAVFAMCRFSLATILWNWWENAEIDISRVNDSKHNLLEIAAWAGSLPICRRLVQMREDQGADLDAMRVFFGNALHLASWGAPDPEEVVQMLLDRGADPNARSEELASATALQLASQRGNEDVVQMLLDKGADVNAEGGEELGTALQEAAYEGHEKVVQILLRRGADVNAQAGVHGTALQGASGEGNTKIVRILLDRHADVNAGGGNYGKALFAASLNGHKDIVQMLLDRNADVNARPPMMYGNALHAAASEGHDEVVGMLLDRGGNVNTGASTGSVRMAARQPGNEKVLQVLLDRGIDVNTEGSARYM